MSTSGPANRIPDGVVREFRDGLVMFEADFVSPMFQVSIDQAAVMARLETPEGEVVEWWEAPNEAGGTFIYLRQITADGGDETGSTQGDSAEGRPPGVLPMVLMVEETLRRGRWFVAGHVYRPEAVAVRFAFADGRSHEVAVQPNGYFLDLLPWPSEEQPSQFETMVLDRHGAVIEDDQAALAAVRSPEEDEQA